MKKFLKILLIVILIIAVAVGAFAVWQWDNIKAVITSATHTQEEIDALVAENEEEINKILSELTESKFYPLTDEQRQMLMNGEISEEEALYIIKNGALSENISAEPPAQDGKAGASPEQNDAGSASKGNDKTKSEATDTKNGKSKSAVADTSKVDDIVSRIYLTRAEYVNALSSLEAEAKSTAGSIPNKERTISRKLDLIDLYTGRAVALEGQCDSKMESLIGELSAELKASGSNMEIISQVRSVYATEKELKKSQLLSKYGKYL